MNYNKFFKIAIYIFLIAIFTFFIFFTYNIEENKETVKLSSCIDGDTARFYINGIDKKVRFIGINAPETEGNEMELGLKSKDFVCDYLKNAKEITLQHDPKSDNEDKYGRLLYWIFVDGKLLEEEIVKNGYARVSYIYDDYLYVDELFNAQDYAKNQKIGIWSK